MDETFWQANGDWISAAISLVVAFAFAFAVDRFVIARATAWPRRVATSPSRARRRRGCA